MTAYFLFAPILLSVALPVFYYNAGKKTAKRGKRALAANLVSFASTVAFSVIFVFGSTAYGAESQPQGLSELAVAAAFIGAALVTGMCCIGTGIAVGSAATAAIGAISEDEKIMGKALIFVAMAEGIAIYGLLISFMLLGRV